AKLPGITSQRPPTTATDSLQYYVIRVETSRAGCSRDQLYDRLRRFNVFTRKYFFPLASEYACYRGLPSAAADRLPVAHRVAAEVLCLPLYGDLMPADATRI